VGNRAIITLKEDEKQRGVYVQWRGGNGSIQAYIEETRRRFTFTAFRDDASNRTSRCMENDIVTFYAILYGVIREFFGYCTKYTTRESLSVHMVESGGWREFKDDNGVYVVDADYMCDRFNEPEYSPYEKYNVKNIRGYYEETHVELSKKHLSLR